MTLFLSRVRLRHAPEVGALARILLPDDANARVANSHRLIWSLFADASHPVRDFLWRTDGGDTWQGTTFLALSRRAPEDRNGLFEIETKEFSPTLAVGQCLRFRLRASPSTNVPASGGRRGSRRDPVAMALANLPHAERRECRYEVLQREGRRWLEKQGGRAGFRLPEDAPFVADGEHHPALRRDRARPIRFPVLDLEGVLEVTQPEAFSASLAIGFGRAKAFGCGLMLIRRP